MNFLLRLDKIDIGCREPKLLKDSIRQGNNIIISAAIPVTTDYGGDGFAFNSAKYENQEPK